MARFQAVLPRESFVLLKCGGYKVQPSRINGAGVSGELVKGAVFFGARDLLRNKPPAHVIIEAWRVRAQLRDAEAPSDYVKCGSNTFGKGECMDSRHKGREFMTGGFFGFVFFVLGKRIICIGKFVGKVRGGVEYWRGNLLGNRGAVGVVEAGGKGGDGRQDGFAVHSKPRNCLRVEGGRFMITPRMRQIALTLPDNEHNARERGAMTLATKPGV